MPRDTRSRFLQEPEVRKHLDAQGMTASGGTPAQFGQRMRKDYDAWLKVVKDSNIKSE